MYVNDQGHTSSIGNFLSLRLIEDYFTIFAFNTFCLFQLNLNLISIIKFMFHDRIRLVVSFAICHALPQPKCRCNNWWQVLKKKSSISVNFSFYHRKKNIWHTWSKVENISSEQPKNINRWFDKKSTEYFLLKRGNLIFCYTSDCCQLAKLLPTSYQRCCDHDDTLII